MDVKTKNIKSVNHDGSDCIKNGEHQTLLDKPKFDIDLFNKYIQLRTGKQQNNENVKDNSVETMEKLHHRFSRGGPIHRHIPTR